MKQEKYFYNPSTLRYEKIETSITSRVLRIIGFLSSTFVFAILLYIAANSVIDSPKEKILKSDNSKLKEQYLLLEKDVDNLRAELDKLHYRDNSIYRTIFETDPIAEEIWMAGTGGSNKYKELENYPSSKLMIEISSKVDQIEKQLEIHDYSLNEVMKLAQKKEHLLAAIPAIQPVANKDLTRMASGFGYRIHPIYKTRKMHQGMDFTAPTGTPIYATGDGTVFRADRKSGGFGNHVRIDHGFGYVTLYAHLSKINVRKGDKIKRGDVIGLVGNTGRSVGPHLHYEVRKNGTPINPVNFFFNDLSEEEYNRMIEMSNSPTQSLD